MRDNEQILTGAFHSAGLLTCVISSGLLVVGDRVPDPIEGYDTYLRKNERGERMSRLFCFNPVFRDPGLFRNLNRINVCIDQAVKRYR